MPITNYPKGLSSFGVPLPTCAEIPVTLTGVTYYVGNATGQNGTTGSEGTDPKKPLSTIAGALTKCTSNAMDNIVVLPGYTETVSAASGLNISVAGVTVVGLGSGSLRPTISLSATGSTIAMSAANTTLKNFIVKSTIADNVVAIITSANNVTLDSIEFPEPTADLNIKTCIATDAVANSSDGLTISGCSRDSVDAATLAMVSILEAQNDVTIADCYDYHTYGANIGQFLIQGAFELLNIKVLRNTLIIVGDNSGQSVGNLITGSGTASFGIVAYNVVGGIDVGGLLDTATLDYQHFENYFAGILAKSGLILPAIS